MTIKTGREKIILFLISLITILPAACSVQANNSTATPTPWYTWTLGITKTFTSSPTSIVVYTRTPTPTPISTSTILVRASKPTETPYYLKNDFPNACREQYSDNATLISPDGNWLAEECFEQGGMQISNKTGTRTILVPSKDYYNDPSMPEHRASVRPVHWSNDGQYIYFTVTPEQWMEGGFISISELAPALYRLEIAGGKVSQFLRGIFYYSFSPTDRRLIEVQEYQHPAKIVIHDLKSGESKTITPVGDIPFSQVGSVVWSPDGLNFAFVAGYGNAYNDETDKQWIHSLIAVDLRDLSQQIIAKDIDQWIETVAWDASDLITYTIQGQETISYTYDYKSGTVNNQATATP